MGFIIKLCLYVILAVVIWHLCTRKYLNPYKTYMIIGKKGSGKTSTMTRLIYEHIRKGWNVYCTDHYPGTTYIPVDKIGKAYIQPNSVLFVDEVGMVWDCRKHKEFPDYLRDFFKLSRHYKIKIYMFSQTFDVDKKIRDLTDNMYLINNVARVFAYGKRIIKVPDLVKPSAEGSARLDDVLKFDSFFWFWCGSRIITYIPRYAGLFDSYCAPVLPHERLRYFPPVGVPRSLLRSKHTRKPRRNKRAILLRSFFAKIKARFRRSGVDADQDPS